MKIKTTHLSGQVGKSGSGYEAEIMQGSTHPKTFIGLKGGLGDARSDSLYDVGRSIIEETDGEFAVGLIATTRPKNIVAVLRGDPQKARQRRSQSVYGAMRHSVEHLSPDEVLLGGQSQGGISVVDAVAYGIKNKKDVFPDNTQVFTIDTPSMFGAEEHKEHPLFILPKLGIHCAKDAPRIPLSTYVKIVKGNTFSRSMFEPVYFAREAMYLLDNLDASEEAITVRTKYLLHHLFHKDDIVPGAEQEEHPFVTVFDGGHVEAMTREGIPPVRDYIIGLSLRNCPIEDSNRAA